MTRVLLAPDKFKGTLTAAQVADLLAAAIPGCEVTKLPVADGGDGLLAAVAAAGFDGCTATAADALGVARSTSWARRGDVAVIELAAICGLARLGDRRAPLTATSRGVGEILADALDAGCTRVLLGVGGSASTDGGLGMVQALGAQVLDAAGRAVSGDAFGLERAVRVELAALHPRLTGATLDVACDVDNPLTGPSGAAAGYGPQKGADSAQVDRLDGALAHWADLVAAVTGHDHRADPGAGAAGGVGFAAAAVLGGTLRPGAQLVLDLIGFADALANADVVVTGEGSLDAQTLRGKAPAVVAAAARAAGIPVVAVAGRCSLDETARSALGLAAVYSLTAEAGGDPEQAMADAAGLLRRVGERIATDWC